MPSDTSSLLMVVGHHSSLIGKLQYDERRTTTTTEWIFRITVPPEPPEPPRAIVRRDIMVHTIGWPWQMPAVSCGADKSISSLYNLQCMVLSHDVVGGP